MPKIIHLGIGNFHRAHQACYTQRANALGGDQWRIVGVSLNRPDMRDSLKPQNFEYTLAIKSSQSSEYEKMSVHDNILVGPEDPQSVLDQIADPQTEIVTLTVTEKGYHRRAGSGALDLLSDDITAELASGSPKTAIGFLAHGLAARKAGCGKPLTIISCDNLPENGSVLEKLVCDFAGAANLEISAYLDEQVSFPNSMIDRIVPATNDDLRREVETATGVKDTNPVSTEAFSEWVIEDNFSARCPRWNEVGVTIVEDVTPYELRKLRLLNGSHSLMAYAGLLAGHRYVHKAVIDPDIRQLVSALMGEATQTLPDSVKANAAEYCSSLFDRFENPSLQHELAQIACDGSLKLPVRILPVLSSVDPKGEGSAASQAIRLWARYVNKQLASGNKITDPKADIFEKNFSALSEKDFFKSLITILHPDLSVANIAEQAF